MKMTVRKLMTAVAALALLMLPVALWFRRHLEYRVLAAKYRELAAYHNSKSKGYKCSSPFYIRCFKPDGAEVHGREAYIEYCHQFMEMQYKWLDERPWNRLAQTPPRDSGGELPPRDEFPDLYGGMPE